MFSHVLSSLQSNVANPTPMAGPRRVTHPVCGPFLYPSYNGLDPFGDSSSYFEWLNGMGMGMGVNDNQFNNTKRGAVPPRSTRRTSTDISMPDYIPLKSNSQCEEQQHPQGAFSQDDDKQTMQLKVPTNTPTAVDVGSYQNDGR